MARQRSSFKEESAAVVTPQMLELGVKALAAWRHASDYQAVAAIYRAMAAQAPRAGTIAEVTRAVIEALGTQGYLTKRDDLTT